MRTARRIRRNRCHGLLLAGYVLAAAGASPEAPDGKQSKPDGPSIQLSASGHVEVVGLPPAMLDRLEAEAQPGGTLVSGVLSVTVVGAEVPMLGTLRLANDVLRFEPRYPLRPGQDYLVVFDPASHLNDTSKHPVIEKTVEVPRPSGGEPPRVEAVYPSAKLLPENLLRFYLHFSHPMSRGEAYDRVHLLDSKGQPIQSPFLELDEELWDPSGTRLTLLIDPGRIKRGLVPREQLGPVLERGHRYTLVIDAGWPDAQGRPLDRAVRKSFDAGPMDESPPDPARWRIAPPVADGREPLSIRFPEPLDHALMSRLIRVVDATGHTVPGRVAVRDHERRWMFHPRNSWRAGSYRIVVNTILEDLVGNGVGRPFEVDVFDRVERQVESETVTVPFQVETASRDR